MKQHMLTHKIRDMPQHMFDKPPNVGEEPTQNPPHPQQQQQQQVQQSHTHLQQQQAQQQSPQQQATLPLLQQSLPQIHHQQQTKDVKSESEMLPLHHQQSQIQEGNSEPAKRAPAENDLPLPKRPPSKCHAKIFLHFFVCNK